MSTGIGFFAMWWATGSIKIGVTFGIAELVYKPIQYYLHERIWYKWIKFGVINEFKNKKKTQVKLQDEVINEIKTQEISISELPSKKTLNYSSSR